MKGYFKIRNSDELFIEKTIGYSLIKFIYSSCMAKPILRVLCANNFVSVVYGRIMKSKLSQRLIKQFIIDNGINISESSKDVSEFKSFNDFFIRELKQDARSIDHNDSSIISPSDGKIVIYENINHDALFNIKGNKLDIVKLLNDINVANLYENCSIVIVRLAPNDYHRFHFSTDGIAANSRLINGAYYSVSPIALKFRPTIFWENKRTITEIKNDVIGDYLYLEIGATLVGSIKQTYRPNSSVNKGAEKGYFEFGGSTVVLLFKEGKVKFDADIVKNTSDGYETKIEMGQRIGTKIE